MVGQLLDLRGPVLQHATRLRIRPADARPVRTDHPDAERGRRCRGRLHIETGAESAVTADHRAAARVADLEIGDPPPVGEREDRIVLRHRALTYSADFGSTYVRRPPVGCPASARAARRTGIRSAGC